jgi:fumarylacetoacetase
MYAALWSGVRRTRWSLKMLIQKADAYLLDETHDPKRKSWVEMANDPDADFPIQNLPLGIFSPDKKVHRIGIAVGDQILDVNAAVSLKLLQLDPQIVEALEVESLNALFSLGRPACRQLRRAVANLLDAATAEGLEAAKSAHQFLYPMAACTMKLPTIVGNYSDFYAGIYHARAAGALFNPEEPLPPNYKWMPIGYHGRASSVRLSGGAVRRPRGQRLGGQKDPTVGRCEQLDFELELGIYLGPGNSLGEPIDISDAADHVAGICLLNDWSARDIQRWEMRPLGPFLGKSFSTTVSPWVVTIDALEPYRVPAFVRTDDDPAPLPYLSDSRDISAGGFDIELEVSLRTAEMSHTGLPAERIITSNAKYLYWTVAQMISHHSSGGCNLQPGDLIGTGTISGPTRRELSSLLELTYDGREPVTFHNGESRSYLEDGDEVTFSARCRREGYRTIGFGQAVGTIVP